MEVIAAMAARTLTAAAVFATAAVVVYAVCRDRRLHKELAQERAASTAARLMDGCLHRDLEVFRSRMDVALAERAVVVEAGRALDEALVSYSMNPYDPEGGPAA